MRKIIAFTSVLFLLSCTPTASEKASATVGVKTALCSAADYSKLTAILDNKALTTEQKIVDAAIQIGPDVMACLLQAKATTTVAAGSGSGQ